MPAVMGGCLCAGAVPHFCCCHQERPRRIHPAHGERRKRQAAYLSSLIRKFSVCTSWEIHLVLQKPYEQVLQADGEKLYIYDKDLNQVTIRTLGNAIGSSPAAILFGSNDLEKNFTLSEAGARDGIEWLQAIPKAKDTQFEKIGIGLRDGVPVAMELRDSFGQVSILSFNKFEKNPVLPSGQFKFVMPKGADVLQQ